VEMILRLKKQIKKMQSEMNKLFDTTQQELDIESEKSKEIVQTSSQRLLRLKREVSPASGEEKPVAKTKKSDDGTADNWEVEYED
jgi:hypothetical protein